MMSNPAQKLLLQGFKSQLSTSGEDVAFRGATYKAIVSDDQASIQFMDSGSMQQADLSVQLLEADMNPRPSVNETMTWDGTTYRVSQVRRASGVSYTLTLVRDN
jgi:hypothetical protein